MVKRCREINLNRCGNRLSNSTYFCLPNDKHQIKHVPQGGVRYAAANLISDLVYASSEETQHVQNVPVLLCNINSVKPKRRMVRQRGDIVRYIPTYKARCSLGIYRSQRYTYISTYLDGFEKRRSGNRFK